MLFYTSSIPITIRTKTQVRHIESSKDDTNLNPARVYSFGRSEWDFLDLYAKEKQLKIEEILTVYDDSSFATWSHMPKFLGRKDKDFTSLIDQLVEIKNKHPNRTKFRIAINNGFGSSLGDSLIGISAFKHVYPYLKQILPDLQIDIIMGWIHGESVVELYKQVPEFNSIIEQNVSLADLSEYQAVIDFYGLLKLPNYGKIPVVDWYMLWMGIDIDHISARNKRNNIHIPMADGVTMNERLGEFSGRTILLNSKASVDLRCVPLDWMQALTKHLLEHYPEDRFVTLQNLDIEHPRLLDFSGKTENINLLAALVYAVDALITPDTYTLHLADATNTPCVALYTSVSPRRYPYYLLTESILIPDAAELSAWNKSKVTEEEWSDIKDAYKDSWSKLEFSSIRIALDDVLTRSIGKLQQLRPQNTNVDHSYVLENGKWRGVGLSGATIVDQIELMIRMIAKQYLVYGDTVVCMGGGFSELNCEISQTIGELGEFHLYEPRRQILQLDVSNFVTSQISNVFAHQLLPYDTNGSIIDILAVNVKNEYNTISANNAAIPERVMTTKLDDWKLSKCRMIIINKPMSATKALLGSIDTISNFKPVLLISCKTDEIESSIDAVLNDVNYSYKSYAIDSVGEYSLIMGVAKSK